MSCFDILPNFVSYKLFELLDFDMVAASRGESVKLDSFIHVQALTRREMPSPYRNRTIQTIRKKIR